MKIVFETSRLLVRKARPGDESMYTALWNNSDIMKNVGFPAGLNETEKSIRNKILACNESEYDSLLVIVLKETGQCIGECKLYLPDEKKISKTDVKLLPEFHKKGYGREVKQGLLDYLFLHTDCKAVDATPNVNNQASVKMQEAVGGIRIGEETYEFPESMRAYTCPVHYYIYRVYRCS